MSDPVDTTASGVGITSFILQVFNQIVQGYQFWSKVSSVPQRYEHLLFRIELEETRFKTCSEKAGLADPNTQFSCDELEIRKPLIEKLIAKVKELLLQVKRISENCWTSTQKNMEPSLSDKMAFCMVLARCIHEFHTIGWLHKGIRSTNIVFVVREGETTEFEKPYLIGFEIARPSVLKDLTTQPRVVASHEEIYRHPNAQSPGISSNYRRSYDLHSLGIVLIEMILWKPIEQVLRMTLAPAKRSKIRHIKEMLQRRRYERSVAIAAGDGFAQVVHHCLHADVVEMQAADESTADLDIQDLMSQKIVAPLERLVLALSTT